MSEDQIFEIVVSPDYVETEESLHELTRRYVSKLSAVSDVLDDDDLASLICIAIDLYQRGLRESDQRMNVHASPKQLQ